VPGFWEKPAVLAIRARCRRADSLIALCIASRFAGTPQSFADAMLINQVFQNLVSNALKYTGTGQIVIGAERSDEGGGVRCWVSDTGVGIPADRLKKIFRKFETDPDNKSGHGLGLAIVKQIVEAHDGDVEVESTVGQGSKFRFTPPGKRGK
jgi:signal transduction histidine kinase